MSMIASDLAGIMDGLNDAAAILRGEAEPKTYRVHVPETVDIRAMRKQLHMTQAQFADSFGLSLGAVRDWEQGRKTPEPSTRVMLRIIEREPEAVMRALRQA